MNRLDGAGNRRGPFASTTALKACQTEGTPESRAPPHPLHRPPYPPESRTPTQALHLPPYPPESRTPTQALHLPPYPPESRIPYPGSTPTLISTREQGPYPGSTPTPISTREQDPLPRLYTYPHIHPRAGSPPLLLHRPLPKSKLFHQQICPTFHSSSSHNFIFCFYVGEKEIKR